jgi:hypothetical protein
MAYCGHKKEDIEDTSMNSYWKPARPAPSWNPWGQLPPPQRGGGGEEEEKTAVCDEMTRWQKSGWSPQAAQIKSI